jgi:hypothetical protein
MNSSQVYRRLYGGLTATLLTINTVAACAPHTRVETAPARDTVLRRDTTSYRVQWDSTFRVHVPTAEQETQTSCQSSIDSVCTPYQPVISVVTRNDPVVPKADTAASKPGMYVVQPGDRLWAIAEKLRPELQMAPRSIAKHLIQRNPETVRNHGNLIVVGDTLFYDKPVPHVAYTTQQPVIAAQPPAVLPDTQPTFLAAAEPQTIDTVIRDTLKPVVGPKIAPQEDGGYTTQDYIAAGLVLAGILGAGLILYKRRNKLNMNEIQGKHNRPKP